MSGGVVSLPIHQDIFLKLQSFYENRKIPNIIFHGQCGSGKKTIVQQFIQTIYGEDKEKIRSFVMKVNCAHGKGIKFIREELKFFAKTHINSNGGDIFKSIILINADKLTIDAQSALRRCIELFSHTTRFFIVIEDKYKLLKPILSRFCEIYVPEPIIDGKPVHLHTYLLNETFKMKDVKTARNEWLKKELKKIDETFSLTSLLELCEKLYEKAYSALDIIYLVEYTNFFKELGEERKYEILFTFNKVRKEFRSEKMMMMFILNFIYFDGKYCLENISFL